MKHRSLQGRMLRALLVWVLLAWVVALATLLLFTQARQTSNWDEKLQSMGVRTLQLLPADIGTRPLSTPRLQARTDSLDAADGLTFQVWQDHRVLLASTPGAPAQALQPTFGAGLSNVQVQGRPWRVFSVSDRSGRYQVQVGNARALINADFQKHSAKAVTLAALGMGLAGGVMWLALRAALRPIAAFEQGTRQRPRFDLTPLPTDTLPQELLPLVDAFNAMLVQLDAAIQAERQFISDAAHELRTPLAALQAQLEVAMRARSDGERARALQTLLVGVKRSGRLSEQLLDLARLEVGQHAPERGWHDLDEIVGHVVHEFEVGAVRSGRLLSSALAPCLLYCDVDELGILVRNLLDNALRYTPAGGAVRVACGTLDTNGPVYVSVSDNGPGVPDNEHQAIFQRFHRASGRPAARGSGIGLSLVARICAGYGARIDTGPGFGHPGFCVRVCFPADGAN